MIVIIVGISNQKDRRRRLFSTAPGGGVLEQVCENINGYLVNGPNVIIEPRRETPAPRSPMMFGNMPRDGGGLLATAEEAQRARVQDPTFARYLSPFVGSEDFIQGKSRYCLWISDADRDDASASKEICDRLARVRAMRLESKADSTREWAQRPHKFVQIQGVARRRSFVIPRHSSERRPYLPVGLLGSGPIDVRRTI